MTLLYAYESLQNMENDLLKLDMWVKDLKLTINIDKTSTFFLRINKLLYFWI